MTFIPNKDFRYSVAEGNVNGASTVNKFGYNDDVDSGSEEIIAKFGGTFLIMTGADNLDIVSSSVNDTAAGTGARSVFISGIDGSGEPVSEIVAMAGTSNATTVNTYVGVNRMYVLSSGSLGYNDGTITVTDNGGSFGTQASIEPNISVTQQLIYHTTVGKNFLADWLFFNINKISGGASPVVTIRGYSYSRVIATTFEVFKITIDTDVENTVELNPSQPFVIGGQEVLYFTAESNQNNTIVRGRFSGVEL